MKEPQKETETRRAALEILLATESSGRFVDDLFFHQSREDHGQAGPSDDRRDVRLLQEITYGTIRHQNTLDYLLAPHLKASVSQQTAPCRWALRLGAFQVVYLSRVPVHAALYQTLEGLKGIAGVRNNAVGFVNAVLRNLLQRVGTKTEAPPAKSNDPAYLPIRQGYCVFRQPVLPAAQPQRFSVMYSHPAWLVERWLGRYGEEETRALCESNNRIPKVTARVSRLAPSRDELLTTLKEEGFDAREGALEDSIVFERAGPLEDSGAFSRGWFQVQDETALRIGAMLQPTTNGRVLDLCAAPGGKATQLQEHLGEGGRFLATDREARLRELRETLSRAHDRDCGAEIEVRATCDDAQAIDLGERFTHVLVDVPCSNTGVLARRPEARWRVRPADLDALGQLQLGLLEAGVRHLQKGGRILYSTCSIEPEENETIVARACAAHPELTELKTNLFLPHRTDGDGGYFSLMVSQP